MGVDVDNTGVHVEITGVGIDAIGVQDTSNKGNNNESEDDNTRKIPDKDTPEEDVNNPHITSPTEWRIYNLRPINQGTTPILPEWTTTHTHR